MYYKIFSTEKCVCFIFLVILLILNCCAYRIDNLSPPSERNSRKSSIIHTSFPISTSTFPFSSSIFKMQQRNEDDNFSQHKVRHHHDLLMKQSQNTADSFSYSSLLMRNSNYIQKRSFLKNGASPKNRSRVNNTGLWKTKQNEDITWRAYKSEFVVHAELVAKSNTTSDSQFSVIENYKRYCKGPIFLKHRQQHKIGQHFLLFLNSTASSESTRFKSVSNPKLIKFDRFNDTNIKKVCSKDFRK